MKHKKALLLCAVFLVLGAGLFLVPHTGLAEGTTTFKPITPRLSIPIPEVSFTPASKSGDSIAVNYLGQYIDGIYRYVLSISVILVIVMGMVGGVQYVLAAGSGSVETAKKRIRTSVEGLVLLLCAYVILYTVNPALVRQDALLITSIDQVELVRNSGDTSGGVNLGDVESIGIICDSSQPVPTIARSFAGKTTYRYGGKGGPPPYRYETKSDESGTPYRQYCPNSTVCLDCSGFVAAVATCAGLESRGESGGSFGIFSGKPKIASCLGNSITLEDGTSTELTAGDLIGFHKGDWDNQPEFGHVWMALGDGNLINSVGSGRKPGTAVRVVSLSNTCGKFPILRFSDRP